MPFGHHRIEELQLQIGQGECYLLQHLASPAKRADDGGVPCFWPQRIGEDGGIKCQGMSSGENCRRAYDHRCRIHQCLCQVAGAAVGEIKSQNPDSSGDQSIDEVVRHDPCGTMHGDKGQNHLVLNIVRSPIPVTAQYELRPIVSRPVTGGDDINFQCGDLFQVFLNLLPEGHHDLGVISLGGFIDGCFVLGIEVAGGQMRAEKIAGEEDPLFCKIGEHRVRPVHPGSADELQSLAAQIDHFAIFHLLHSLLAHEVELIEQLQAFG